MTYWKMDKNGDVWWFMELLMEYQVLIDVFLMGKTSINEWIVHGHVWLEVSLFKMVQKYVMVYECCFLVNTSIER